jgi:hypothetical protein
MRLIFLLGLLPPAGIIVPAFLRLRHQPAIVIGSFGVLLALAWLCAVNALRKKSRWSRQGSGVIVAVYLAIGTLGLIRFDFIRYEFNSLGVLLVLGPWVAIWIITPVVLWLLIARMGRPGTRAAG